MCPLTGVLSISVTSFPVLSNSLGTEVLCGLSYSLYAL